MRKSLIAGFAAVILAISGLCGGIISIAGQAEEVYLTEEVLIGDRRDAEDVSFQINSQWDDKLLWETCVEIGEETQSQTKFSFHPNGIEYVYHTESEVRIDYPISFGIGSSSNLLDNEEHSDIYYKKVFFDVADRTKNGEEHTETVRLADYYDYFELELTACSDAYPGSYIGSLEKVNARLSEVMALRLPEEMGFEATVEKNEQGQVHNVEGNDKDMNMRIVSGGTVLRDGIYVYAYMIEEDQGFVPGASDTGYGIYKLPLTWSENGMGALQMDEFRLVYPVEDKILAMKADPEEKEFFLLINRDRELYLQRVDCKEYTLLQEFALGNADEILITGCQDMIVDNEGILILTDDGRLYYAENQGNSYKITIDYDLSAHDFFRKNQWYEYAYEYKDGRIVFVWKDGYHYTNSNSVYVFVIEGEQMKFLAHYQNSLDHAVDTYQYTNMLHRARSYEIFLEDSENSEED